MFNSACKSGASSLFKSGLFKKTSSRAASSIFKKNSSFGRISSSSSACFFSTSNSVVSGCLNFPSSLASSWNGMNFNNLCVRGLNHHNGIATGQQVLLIGAPDDDA
ncbi:hypothetical protein FDP41_006068 [Naegleria fowleri]|uniref:Uncharacterized protein n=1 Tax=Naegleria fowleri TaxID=5763 RepID=A0A6A5BKK8_NAEFO|nr:uncharacterized protein FDP41_006068 [Naegleria fowleri]KAF0974901.1 hypothetical protein FDP41_006068 [Naegleria fowleri]